MPEDLKMDMCNMGGAETEDILKMSGTDCYGGTMLFPVLSESKCP